MKRMTPVVVTLALAAAQPSGFAQEAAVRLRDGEGRQLVEANCSMCHSLDYIPMNSPFLDRKGWEASVGKMIRVMGAPIRSEDAAVIVDYLSARYGR